MELVGLVGWESIGNLCIQHGDLVHLRGYKDILD